MEIRKVPRAYAKSAGDSFCMDDCICTYASSKNAIWQMIYLETLRTPFWVENGEIKKSKNSFFLHTQELCGITIMKLEIANKEDLIEKIVAELDDQKIVSIGIKGCYCPWDWRFQEWDIEGGHQFFIIGAKHDKREFICVDPYYDQTNVEIPYEYIAKGYISSETYDCKPVEWKDEELVNKIFNEEKYWKESLNEISYMSGAIQHYLEETIDSLADNGSTGNTYLDMNTNVVYSVMEEMSDNRVRFSWFLQYLMERKIINSDELINRFIDISKMWDTLKKSFAKSVYRGRRDASMIRDKLAEIYCFEENAEKELIDILHGNDVQRVTSITSVERMCELYYKCDLRDYYNNHGVKKSDDDKADFSGFGEWIDGKSFLSGSEIEYHNIPFSVLPPRGDLDNIVCKKQEIVVPPQKYKKLYILACSDWEDCRDYIQIRYKCGAVDNKMIEIAEWLPNRMRKTSNLCITAKKNIKRSNSEFEDCYISFYELDCAAIETTSIVLPNCENIHVFAITLGY